MVFDLDRSGESNKFHHPCDRGLVAMVSMLYLLGIPACSLLSSDKDRGRPVRRQSGESSSKTVPTEKARFLRAGVETWSSNTSRASAGFVKECEAGMAGTGGIIDSGRPSFTRGVG
ncbi:hypothetical protein I7I50_12650 [Histoplasma capsulatum G186AR]|uniref:Uncharacterized protein n=1 Tax=Ajellomyces capsulatus TaxID=5037 RepID=A0A8H8CRS8_AJECA|nr:hypothetical protein I7I52_11045 [Histoplasma capsulatum]QSS70875.1 hypothetical protein I7I50_12650 [Histoplasma capsulatum G186AR]